MIAVEPLEEVFRAVFDDPELELTDDTTAADVPGWDSLAQVTLIVAVERAFGVRFGAQEIHRMRNVGDLRRSLAARA